MSRSASRAALAIALVTNLVVLSGCSVSAPRATTNTVIGGGSDPYIHSRDLASQPHGSPGQQVLRFCQLVQKQDYGMAFRLLAPGFVAWAIHNFGHFVAAVSSERSAWLRHPSVAATQVHGENARVVVGYTMGETPTLTAFDLIHRRGVWLIAYEFNLANPPAARP